MRNIDKQEMGIALIAIGLIGVGLWMYAPWTSFVVVGSIVLTMTIIGRFKRA